MTKYYCQSIFKETLGFRLKEEKKGNFRVYFYLVILAFISIRLNAPSMLFSTHPRGMATIFNPSR